MQTGTDVVLFSPLGDLPLFSFDSPPSVPYKWPYHHSPCCAPVLLSASSAVLAFRFRFFRTPFYFGGPPPFVTICTQMHLACTSLLPRRCLSSFPLRCADSNAFFSRPPRRWVGHFVFFDLFFSESPPFPTSFFFGLDPLGML